MYCWIQEMYLPMICYFCVPEKSEVKESKRASRHFWQKKKKEKKKITHKKSVKIINYFQLYQDFIYNYLSQNAPIRQSHHLVGCHATGINFLFTAF